MGRINMHAASMKILISSTLLVFVAGASIFFHATLAHADGNFCQLSSGDPCKEVFATGSPNQPIQITIPGPGNTFIQSVLRAYAFAGVDSREKDTYMLFHLTITLSPDPNSSFENWLIPNGFSPDSSQTGDNSTLHVRLWSTNTHSNNCAISTPCSQQNYSGLAMANFCYQDGGSNTFTSPPNITGMSWSIAAPTYHWCILNPPGDIYSQYYDYTLQDMNEARTQIVQDFVFAQWQPSSNHDFKIAYSVQSHLGLIARTHRAKNDGPSISTQYVTYPT